MKTETQSYKLWLAAFEHLVSGLGHGGKTLIAKELGVTRPHVSCLFTENPDRKRIAGQEFQERAAEYFGYSILEFLQLGDSLIKGQPHFGPGYSETAPNSIQRAEVIVKSALTDIGLDDVSFLTFHALRSGGVGACDEYLQGKLSDIEFSEAISEVLGEIGAKLK